MKTTTTLLFLAAAALGSAGPAIRAGADIDACAEHAAAPSSTSTPAAVATATPAVGQPSTPAMTECRCHRFFKDMLHCTSEEFDAQCGAQKACDCSTPFIIDGFGGCSKGRVDTSKDGVAWYVSNQKQCAQAGCARENYEAMCNPNHKPKPRPATPATPAKLDQCDCTQFWWGREQFPDFSSEENCKPDYENKGRDGDFICVQKDCSEAQYGAICGDMTSCDCSKKYGGQQNCSVKVYELMCGRRN